MPPLMAYLKIGSGPGLWLPLFLLWILGLPLVLLALLVGTAAGFVVLGFAPRQGSAIIQLVPRALAVVAALKGMEMEIDGKQRSRVRVRLV